MASIYGLDDYVRRWEAMIVSLLFGSPDAATAGSTKRIGAGSTLAAYPRLSATGLGVMVVVLILASVLTGFATGLPGIAFGWRFGLEITRAAVVFGILALIVTFLVRGWIGEWPRSISTSGLDYSEALEVSEAAVDLREAQAIVDRVRPILESARTGRGAE
jgi:hypothetical protein